MCRLLKVSRSRYYEWVEARETNAASAAERDVFDARVEQLFKQHNGWYGTRRLVAALRIDGLTVGRKRVRRAMRKRGLQPRRPRSYRATTDSSHARPVAANVLNREFSVEKPNLAWVGDITYIKTTKGWLYLAVLLDLCSRRVVGWSLSRTLQRQLCLDALQMALGRRAGRPAIHHSDRGCQYASEDYQDLLRELDIACSMSRKGNCWDNAVAESFFATLKTELLWHTTLSSEVEARKALFSYIEIYYNRNRLHSSLGYQTPAQFEERHTSTPAQPAELGVRK